MKYLITGCLLWKFLAEREVSCDYISDISNVGYKLGIPTSNSRLVDLKGEFLLRLILSLYITLMSH
jgi:hypothetical protein